MKNSENEKSTGLVSSYLSPNRMILIIAILVFISEAFVMLLLPEYISHLPLIYQALLDSALLVVLLSLPFYLVLFRPLVNYITELKKADREIIQLNEDLQRHALELTAVNKELEAFSYSVSHDLRSPLRSIDGFSQALLEDYSDRFDDTGKDYIGRVRAASQRMGQLIDDMLKLSRLNRNEMTLEKVDLSAMVESICNELHATQPERHVEFVIARGISVKGDVRLLRVFMENLLNNAWKFTGNKSNARIEFGVSQKDGEDCYFIQDNGAGFDMTYANKLFGAFQRLHDMEEFSGTGIGLAIVQRIVHRHGGKVWAKGEVGKGATFNFTLG